MSKRPKCCDFSSFAQDMILHDLNQITWDSTDDVNDVDKILSSFFSKVNRVINKHGPLNTASRKKVKQLLKAWIMPQSKKDFRKYLTSSVPFSWFSFFKLIQLHLMKYNVKSCHCR